MILAHRIALDPTPKQANAFARACGVARFAYNWGLAQWKQQYAAGKKPSAKALKAQWNAIRRVEFPWSYEVTKCASGEAFVNLGRAFQNFFRDLKKGAARRSGFPKFKKKGRNDSFALWNDQFVIAGSRVRVPNLGWVALREPLRFHGKIMGATVSQTAGRWFIAVHVEMPDVVSSHATPGSVVGIDVGVKDLMALSQPLPDGTTKVANPCARARGMRRMKQLQRRVSRQDLARRRAARRVSNRQKRRRAALAKVHYRTACVRNDALHKATAAVANAFETVVLEDLNVSGMSKNHALAGVVLDASFGELRRQLLYKTALRGGRVILADRFFPSSKTCSACRVVTDKLPLSVRTWTCKACNAAHDRDLNAAKNLELVGRASPEPLRKTAETHGETVALVVRQQTTKLRSVNRELLGAHSHVLTK